MKKRLFYLLFVALAAISAGLLSLTSCSKDDDNLEVKNPIPELSAKLVGQWKYVGTFDASGKLVDKLEIEMRRDFDLDGTLTTYLDGKNSTRAVWKIEPKDADYILWMGGFFVKIRYIGVSSFEMENSNGDIELYVRANTTSVQK